MTPIILAASAFFYIPKLPTYNGKPLVSNMPVVTAPSTPITYK